ncbi:MAG: T9SS sorting signal type C domain-containing protein [Flavobacterium sp.]|nr:T9SS sorting signal type C domain-containing protein [Flavobacterium sp.]
MQIKSGDLVKRHFCNLINSDTDLTTAPYNFSSDAGTFNNRLEIVYQSQLAITTSIFNANQIVINKNASHDLVIKSGNTPMSSVKIFDIRGRLLVDKKDINTTQININAGTTNQVLLVQISSIDGVVVTKKVIN